MKFETLKSCIPYVIANHNIDNFADAPFEYTCDRVGSEEVWLTWDSHAYILRPYKDKKENYHKYEIVSTYNYDSNNPEWEFLCFVNTSESGVDFLLQNLKKDLKSNYWGTNYG